MDKWELAGAAWLHIDKRGRKFLSVQLKNGAVLNIHFLTGEQRKNEKSPHGLVSRLVSRGTGTASSGTGEAEKASLEATVAAMEKTINDLKASLSNRSAEPPQGVQWKDVGAPWEGMDEPF
jgi:hypothetical protein